MSAKWLLQSVYTVAREAQSPVIVLVSGKGGVMYASFFQVSITVNTMST